MSTPSKTMAAQKAAIVLSVNVFRCETLRRLSETVLAFFLPSLPDSFPAFPVLPS